MLEVVTSRNAHQYQDALQDMFDMRHRIFVERMGWEALRKPDGLEKDQFDNDDAIYLLLTDDDGKVIGSHRMLQTVKPHLFSDVFPQYCAVKGVQRGDKILELTRTCVDEEKLDKATMERARKRIMVGLFEFFVRAGYEYVTMLSPVDLVFRYLLIGIEVKPLGIPAEIDGIKQVALIAPINEEALAKLREAYGIAEPQVVYLGAPENDSLRLVPAEMPQRGLEAAE